MPLFLCRWSNGDCSVVCAPNEEDAIVELDQTIGSISGVPSVNGHPFSDAGADPGAPREAPPAGTASPQRGDRARHVLLDGIACS